MKLLITVATTRPNIIRRLLASLLMQTDQDWDLVFISQYPESQLHLHAQRWLDCLRRTHKVTWARRDARNCADAYNIGLYEYGAEYDALLRLDDDFVLNQTFIAELRRHWKPGRAVGGVYFTTKEPRRTLTVEQCQNVSTVGIPVPAPIYQWRYHPTNEPMEVQSLHSACMYDRRLMEKVGGWPDVYSDIVAHGEETDGTYRMHLAGGQMLIVPTAITQHLWAPGGVRAAPDLEQRRRQDARLWARRYPMLRRINWTDKPTICVASSHVQGYGGGERLFYTLVAMLQEAGYHCVPYGAHRQLEPPSLIEQRYGITYQQMPELPMYDIGIMCGHAPCSIPSCRYCVFYNFYPAGNTLPNVPNLLVGISQFTADAIREQWRREATVIYPPVRTIKPRRKKAWILSVMRDNKPPGAQWVVDFVHQYGLPEGWEWHIVLGTATYRPAPHYADLPNVYIHHNIPQDELDALYGQAAILVAPVGVQGHPEHFGLTVPEAQSAGCLTLAFDAGGHRETTQHRWRDADELNRLLRDYIAHPKKRRRDAAAERRAVCRFSLENIQHQWELLCARIRGMALPMQPRPAHVDRVFTTVGDSTQIIKRWKPGFVRIRAVIQNRDSKTWRERTTAVAYRILDLQGNIVRQRRVIQCLPRPVAAGQSVAIEFDVNIGALPSRRDYRLQLDLLVEGIWLVDTGHPVSEIIIPGAEV